MSQKKKKEEEFGLYPAALFSSVLTVVSEIEICQLFLGQAAAVTCPLIVLSSVSFLMHMEQGRHCCPELAQATEGSFTCVYLIDCICVCQVFMHMCTFVLG